jgi:transposase InsO family protein
MAERKETVKTMILLGMRTRKALEIARLPRSTFYYTPNGRRKGKAPSNQTRLNGVWVDNNEVLEAITRLLGQEFIDYGYIRTSAALKQQGYLINKKKVYRLMKHSHLLYPKRRPSNANKIYVKFTSPRYCRPFEVIEIDIKYVYIQGYRKYAYLITMLDVFSRMALAWDLAYTMKTQEVIGLLNKLYAQWLIPCNIDPAKMEVKIRSDNGSQFVADLFRQHLTESHIKNEYIRPATPQQNGHIESFHSTVSTLVCRKFEFEDIYQARYTFERFYETYNYKRIMKAILYCTPADFMMQWAKGNIGVTFDEKRVNYSFLADNTVVRLPDSKTEIIKNQNSINDLINNRLTYSQI